MSIIKYDIALSFAGENREYVDHVAHLLRENNINVFYDGYEEAELWGKDLYEHLSDIYKNKAKYTIIFISEYYAKKLWTNHERKSAQARAFNERHEYILPARFDDTEIIGIHETIGYIDLRNKTPLDFVKIITRKLNTEISITEENEIEKTYICPYCRTKSSHGTRICLGCQAEIVYGSTLEEQANEKSFGVMLGIFIIIFSLILIPQYFSQHYQLNILTPTTIIIFTVIVLTTTIILTKNYMKKNHAKRSKSPRFFKNMRN